MPDNKVVFIMGPGHCGSTLLDLLLGSHTQAFSLAEIHVIGRFVDSPERASQPICAVCGDQCEFWNKRVRLDALRLFHSRKNLFWKVVGRGMRAVRNSYGPLFEATGKSLLIDSSKNPGWFKQQIATRFAWRDVTPHLIYLGRDGRGVANSYYRKYPERGLEWASQHWKDSIVSMNRFYETFPFQHKTRVRYEDLATSPEQVVRTLCDFAEVPFEPGMLTYWVHDHHPVSGNAGTHSLILRERERRNHASADHRLSVNQDERFYANDHYEDLGLHIDLDLRWKSEMSEEDIQAFERIAGDLNRAFVATEPG